MIYCYKCKQSKDDTDFSPSKRSKQKSICKVCNAIAMKQWRAKNKDYWKKQTAANIGQEFYERRKKRIVSSHLHFLKELMAGASRDRRKELKKNITIEYLDKIWKEQNGCCALSGLKMLHERRNPRSVSIDRINSALGYEKGNIQLLCRFMNLAKQEYSNETMIEILNEIKKVDRVNPR